MAGELMIPLFKPFMPAELPELNDILHSGRLAYGEWGKRFESALGSYLGEERVLTMASYNTAHLVLLAAMDLQPGDEVIASPMSCLASNQPFVTQGITVVWADIDSDRGTLCPDSVRSKLTSKTKAIYHNHFCGYPGHIDEITKIGKEHDLFVVDDAIEAFGASYKSKRIGSAGVDATIFSFQPVRIPNTIEGGAISFGSHQLYDRAILARDYGIDRNTFRDVKGEIADTSDIKSPGFGGMMNEVSSYLGCQQMPHVDELLATHRANALQWDQRLAITAPNCLPLATQPYAQPNFWVYGILAANRETALATFREQGFYASGVHIPNSLYSVFGPAPSLPGVQSFHSKFLALPCGWWYQAERKFLP